MNSLGAGVRVQLRRAAPSPDASLKLLSSFWMSRVSNLGGKPCADTLLGTASTSHVPTGEQNCKGTRISCHFKLINQSWGCAGNRRRFRVEEHLCKWFQTMEKPHLCHCVNAKAKRTPVFELLGFLLQLRRHRQVV